jgi:uncharacterized protein
MQNYAHLIDRLEALLDRAETLLPAGRAEPDWTAHAFRWRKPGLLQAVRHPHRLNLDDLLNIEQQKAMLVQNTRQFMAGLPANNALLSGSRGTGKSSLVKALLTEFADQGLRSICPRSWPLYMIGLNAFCYLLTIYPSRQTNPATRP